MARSSFFAELRKRKVLQSAAIYGAIAWGVTEVVVTIVEQLFLPQWVSTLAVIFFVVGFPVAMFLSWTFDITPEGIRRNSVTGGRGTASIVASLVLLLAGTAGLFFLIKPGLDVRESAASTVLPVAPNSVAVLPFQNAGAKPDDSYLVGGLSDALRDQLSRVADLRIAARVSSVAVLEQGLDAVGIASKLGVAHLVDGSVRREGGNLAVSVQLIDGATGLAVWSETFSRSAAELLAVQQSVAESVVAIVLPDSETPVAEPATRDPTANELLLLARFYEQKVRERPVVDEATLLEAIRLYREATIADPESALAHSRLAGALIYLGDLEAAEAPIWKALALDPNLSEVQHTLGLFHWARGLVSEAGIAWARAVELNPYNPRALQDFARSRWYQMAFEGVQEMLERAVELDPLNLESIGTLGSYLAIKNQPEKTLQLINRLEGMPDDAAAFGVIAQLWKLMGDVDKSIAWTIRARDLEPENPAHTQRLAEYFADIGDFDTALKLDPGSIAVLYYARRYEEMLEEAEMAIFDEPGDIRLRVLMANAYNAVGFFESALFLMNSSGLPDLVEHGWRTSAEWDGLIALINAHHGAGNGEEAQILAEWTLAYGDVEDIDWWWHLNNACMHTILGQYDEARARLEQIQKGKHLAWDPLLKDSPCFERLKDDPVYQSTVEYFDERRAMLRKRLPLTLAEFGVSL